jgi:hypothetical protein
MLSVFRKLNNDDNCNKRDIVKRKSNNASLIRKKIRVFPPAAFIDMEIADALKVINKPSSYFTADLFTSDLSDHIRYYYCIKVLSNPQRILFIN